MRRLLPALLAALALSWGATTGQAQVSPFGGGFSDPFFLYYGFFLPRQAQLAAQPRIDASIQQRAVDQQFRSQSDRAGLYDEIPLLGESDFDPLRPFNRRGTSRRSGMSPTGVTNSNLRGFGPMGYYNRVNQYYPMYPTGRSANANIYKPRRRGMMGMGGMGGMGGGMGGMGGLGNIGGGSSILSTPRPGVTSIRR
jgi:hypothetical protein